MRTKNNIFMMTKGGSLYSSNGLFKNAIKRSNDVSLKSEKATSSVNNAVFGKVLGTKKENDATKIGNIGTGEHKILPSVQKTGGEIDDISAIMKKISFKEKKKKNNITLEI
jgi:hypothetical protein